MADGDTFDVLGRVYPMIRLSEFRFSDWALVREITGLSSQEFVVAHDGDDGGVDKLVVFGYAAVAFWRGNPRMTRSRARDEIEDWAETDVAFLPAAGEDGDATPKAEASEGSPSSEESSTTSHESTASPALPSGEMSPSVSGSPGSDTGSPA